jgi:hypothetical protein
VPRDYLEIRKPSPLACYETSADQYVKASVEPVGAPQKPPEPVLKTRENADDSPKDSPK